MLIIASLLRMSRMCVVLSFVVPILEAVAAHRALPAPCYMHEVDGDGHVLAGVEIDIPGDSVLEMLQFFPLGLWVGRLCRCIRAGCFAGNQVFARDVWFYS